MDTRSYPVGHPLYTAGDIKFIPLSQLDADMLFQRDRSKDKVAAGIRRTIDSRLFRDLDVMVSIEDSNRYWIVDGKGRYLGLKAHVEREKVRATEENRSPEGFTEDMLVRCRVMDIDELKAAREYFDFLNQKTTRVPAKHLFFTRTTEQGTWEYEVQQALRSLGYFAGPSDKNTDSLKLIAATVAFETIGKAITPGPDGGSPTISIDDVGFIVKTAVEFLNMYSEDVAEIKRQTQEPPLNAALNLVIAHIADIRSNGVKLQHSERFALFSLNHFYKAQAVRGTSSSSGSKASFVYKAMEAVYNNAIYDNDTLVLGEKLAAECGCSFCEDGPPPLTSNSTEQLYSRLTNQ